MSADEIVLRIVRGEAPISALRSAGVTITETGLVRAKSRIEIIHPTLDDLAAGLLHHRARKSLAKWAAFVIRAEFIDIQPERDSADWDALLGAVWDAAAP
jgi:hypothetical protein